MITLRCGVRLRAPKQGALCALARRDRYRRPGRPSLRRKGWVHGLRLCAQGGPSSRPEPRAQAGIGADPRESRKLSVMQSSALSARGNHNSIERRSRD